jgi:hypothetical protein
MNSTVRHDDPAWSDCHTEPWLTVIMPAYCAEKWIDLSLRSIEAEGQDGIEVLVIDGSPTGATADMARAYADRLNVRVFERPDLTMWHSKTNFAVGIASARHVCLLCVDDLWLPGRAAAMRRWITNDPGMSLHLAPCTIIDQTGRTLGVWRCPLPAETPLPSAQIMQRLLIQNFISSPAPVFRKDAWIASGGLDESLWYTADWDLWLKLAATGQVLYHSDITTAFRIHGGSLTASRAGDIADFTRQMHMVLDRHLGRMPVGSDNIERVARASIDINVALAEASSGKLAGLVRAALTFLGLGPAGMQRYWRDSRILDRVAPRVIAKLRGTL